jgi:hypothetical protein
VPWVVWDELWERVEPLLPKVERRLCYPRFNSTFSAPVFASVGPPGLNCPTGKGLFSAWWLGLSRIGRGWRFGVLGRQTLLVAAGREQGDGRRGWCASGALPAGYTGAGPHTTLESPRFRGHRAVLRLWWSRVSWFRQLASATVVEDLDVLEDRVRELDAGLPATRVEQLELHPRPERLDHRVECHSSRPPIPSTPPAQTAKPCP